MSFFIYWNRAARAALESWIFLVWYVFEKVFLLKNFWCNDRELVRDLAWSVAVADMCPVVNALIWLAARRIMSMILKKFIFIISDGMISVLMNISYIFCFYSIKQVSLAPSMTGLRQVYSHQKCSEVGIWKLRPWEKRFACNPEPYLACRFSLCRVRPVKLWS